MTTPLVFTLAISGTELDQTPPEVVELSVIVALVQTAEGPVNAATVGLALIVIA